MSTVTLKPSAKYTKIVRTVLKKAIDARLLPPGQRRRLRESLRHNAVVVYTVRGTKAKARA